MAQPPASMSRELFVEAVEHVIRERKTAKVLRAVEDCPQVAAALPPDFNTQVSAVVEAAGWAPFHKKVDKDAHLGGSLTSIVPWRFYILDKAACCTLLETLRALAEAHPDSKWGKAWGKKIPRLLAGAGALVMVTWLPDPPEQGDTPELSENNVEHIAAAAAAVQNLLLAGEARGMDTYWASGGILGDGDVFTRLGIPTNQKLLGAIFLAPSGSPAAEVEPGGLRDKRGESSTWSVWLDGSGSAR